MQKMRPFRPSCTCTWYHLGLCYSFIYSFSRQWRPWSDCDHAQADLCLNYLHMLEDNFLHVAANMTWARAQHFLQDCMCPQLRLACAPAQSDQNLQSAWRRFWSLTTHRVPYTDSNQTVLMCSLVWILTGHSYNLVGNAVCQLICYHSYQCRLRSACIFVFCLFVLRFNGLDNPMGSCRAPSVYLTTHLLGRLSPLSG